MLYGKRLYLVILVKKTRLKIKHRKKNSSAFSIPVFLPCMYTRQSLSLLITTSTFFFTALGPDDYAILSEQLTFFSGSTSGVMCRDIQIEQDNLSENIEIFSVVLTAAGAPDRSATILINDDDGESQYYCKCNAPCMTVVNHYHCLPSSSCNWSRRKFLLCKRIGWCGNRVCSGTATRCRAGS